MKISWGFRKMQIKIRLEFNCYSTNLQQDRQYWYKVIFKRCLVTVVAVEQQVVLHIISVLFLHDNAPAHQHLQPRTNWPTWASTVLITHPILRIWPRRTTTCSPDCKKQLKGRHFSSNAEVIAAAETRLDGQHSEFFFLSVLQRLEQRAKKCIELRVQYVE